MKSAPCIFLFLICLILSACGRSANSIQIGGNQGNSSAIRLNSNSLYINSGLLGIDRDESITINTSSDNELTFDISKEDSTDSRRLNGGAF